MNKNLLFIVFFISFGNFVMAQTDADRINNAITIGDCSTLYVFIQRDGTDPKLVTTATNALKRYMSLDSGTAKYRTDKMDQKVRRVSKDLMDKVFVDPEKILPDVVSFLVKDVSDQLTKVKILHDWICDNIAYDTEMYFITRRITNQDYISVLKKKKAVCSGYSALFNKMCQIANIESISILGYSKGFGYSGKIGNQTDHEWNAVYVGSKWYLVDVTWDAGSVEVKTWIKRYSTDYLFLDSRPFLYSHLPEKNQYQFYAPVLTANEFMREAYIPGKFFKYGLSLVTEYPLYTNEIAGEFIFDITMKNANVSFSSMLRTQNQQNVNSSAWSERKGNIVSFKFDVPDKNGYKGFVFARFTNQERIQDAIDIVTFERDWLPRTEALFNVANIKDRKITEKELEYFKGSYYKVAENQRYYYSEDQFDTARYNAVLKIQKLLEISTTMLESVLDFDIKASSGYSGYGNILKYPNTFTSYNQVSNTQLISPISGTLIAGSEETFVLSTKDFSTFAFIIDDQWSRFTKNSTTGNFELIFTIPQNIEKLELYGITTSGNRSSANGLIQYNIVK